MSLRFLALEFQNSITNNEFTRILTSCEQKLPRWPNFYFRLVLGRHLDPPTLSGMVVVAVKGSTGHCPLRSQLAAFWGLLHPSGQSDGLSSFLSSCYLQAELRQTKTIVEKIAIMKTTAEIWFSQFVAFAHQFVLCRTSSLRSR